jgi:hypothetical protein
MDFKGIDVCQTLLNDAEAALLAAKQSGVNDMIKKASLRISAAKIVLDSKVAPMYAPTIDGFCALLHYMKHYTKTDVTVRKSGNDLPFFIFNLCTTDQQRDDSGVTFDLGYDDLPSDIRIVCSKLSAQNIKLTVTKQCNLNRTSENCGRIEYILKVVFV